jgi:hypothetical protein
MNLDRVPEAFRQVSPRNPSPVAVKHRFDKQPIIPCGNTDMPLTTRQKVSYAFPLLITKGVAVSAAWILAALFVIGPDAPPA